MVVVDGFTRHRGGPVYGCCRWVYKTEADLFMVVLDGFTRQRRTCLWLL